MGCLRPATPGFLVTLIAAALLAVVSFCVPYFKSVYFLKASISVNNVNGSITFGTLGYCLELSNGTTCSKPSIGYQLDINGLVGNSLPIDIPQVAVKWITYALFLHVIALILAVGSAVFGLLAHVREMSMTCCSTCISGFAAGVALLAFIFDLVLFFVAKARINSIGSASIGTAIWLTLAAWILLFFSGCFYTVGRCCVSRRPRGKDRYGDSPKDDYAERMRLDAVKAEADRKARQKQLELGLPAFSETQPLTARIEGDHVYLEDQHSESKDNISANTPTVASRPSQNSLQRNGNNGPNYNAGYVQGTPGNRAVDEYYNPTNTNDVPGPNTYPPQPHRQGSSHAYSNNAPYGASTPAPQRQPSGYSLGGAGAGAGYPAAGYGGYQSTSPPPMPTQMLAVPGQQAYNDPYGPSGQQYGHAAGGSSYHTASPHSQQPSAYSQYDPYAASSSQPQPQQYYSPHPQYAEQPTFLAPQSASPPAPATGYGMSYGGAAVAAARYASPPAVPQAPSSSASLYSSSSAYHPQQPERQYTLNGGGYGANSVPPLPEQDPYGAYPYNGASSGRTPAPMVDTAVAAGTYGGGAGYVSTSPVKGPRAQPPPSVPDEAPPVYEQGGSNVAGQWGKH